MNIALTSASFNRHPFSKSNLNSTGVNGEVIDQNQQSLTLFITVREGEEVNERNRFRFKKRSSSFDLEFYRNEIRQQRKEMCILM